MGRPPGWVVGLLVLVVAASGAGVATSTPPAPGPAGWGHVPPPTRPNPWPRYAAALGYDLSGGDGILFGGLGPGGGTLNDTWVNDGDFPGQWNEVTDELNRSPPALSGAAAAYDVADQCFVLFGGRLANGSAYGGTWEFFGLHQWVPVLASPSPPAQAGASLAYDSSGGDLVLVSSIGNDSTWTFHAGSWHFLRSSVAPAPRSGAAFVQDLAIGAEVLFGGSSAGTPLADTWYFSDGAWTPVLTGTSPPASGNLAATYDERTQSVLLFEGSGPTTWQLAHGTWSQVAGPSATGPGARTHPSLYWDNAVGYDILFGGLAANGTTVEPDAWGWAIPSPSTDPTVTPVPLSPLELGVVVLLVAVPLALAVFLRRRPPRRLPASVPSPVPA